MKKILLAEPKMSPRARLSRDLQEYLLNDLYAPDVLEAVQMAELPGLLANTSFDLILLSERFLIKREGVPTVIEYVRSTKMSAHTPIILLLERDRPDALFSALGSGADDILILDPHETTMFRIKISRWIDQKIDPLGLWERGLSIPEKAVLETAQTVLSEKELGWLKVTAAALSGTYKAARNATPMPYGFSVFSAPHIHCANVHPKIKEFLIPLGGFDEEAIRHTLQVSTIAYGFGRYHNLPSEERTLLWACGWFHDVGRVAMSPETMATRGEFSEDQRREMQNHTRSGENVLRGQVPLCVSQTARQHHERRDGSGYPDGLKGDRIVQNAQRIAIFDTFEAMVSDRSYRDEPFSVDGAMAALQDPQKFDKGQVEEFCRLVQELYRV